MPPIPLERGDTWYFILPKKMISRWANLLTLSQQIQDRWKPHGPDFCLVHYLLLLEFCCLKVGLSYGRPYRGRPKNLAVYRWLSCLWEWMKGTLPPCILWWHHCDIKVGPLWHSLFSNVCVSFPPGIFHWVRVWWPYSCSLQHHGKTVGSPTCMQQLRLQKHLQIQKNRSPAWVWESK